MYCVLYNTKHFVWEHCCHSLSALFDIIICIFQNALHSSSMYIRTSREHHMLHTKRSGVDVDEALRCMSLLRRRLDQSGPSSKINLLTTVSSKCCYTLLSGFRLPWPPSRVRKFVCHLSVTCIYWIVWLTCVKITQCSNKVFPELFCCAIYLLRYSMNKGPIIILLHKLKIP